MLGTEPNSRFTPHPRGQQLLSPTQLFAHGVIVQCGRFSQVSSRSMDILVDFYDLKGSCGQPNTVLGGSDPGSASLQSPPCMLLPPRIQIFLLCPISTSGPSLQLQMFPLCENLFLACPAPILLFLAIAPWVSSGEPPSPALCPCGCGGAGCLLCC